MLLLLSQANSEWLRAHRRGGGSGPLLFLRETGFDLVSETAINDASGTTTASATITVDAQTFPDSAGVAAVWDDDMFDIFSYTSQSSLLFSGVSGLAFAHEDNDPIQPLYKLPTTFNKFRPSDAYEDGVQVNGTGYSFMEGPPTAGHFSMYDDGTSKYLWLPRGLTGSASVLFEKASATIDSTDDTVDVEPEFDAFLSWRIVQTATVPKDGAQPTQLYLLAKTEANKILREALMDKNIGQHVRVRQFSLLGRSIDRSLTQRVPR